MTHEEKTKLQREIGCIIAIILLVFIVLSLNKKCYANTPDGPNYNTQAVKAARECQKDELLKAYRQYFAYTDSMFRAQDPDGDTFFETDEGDSIVSMSLHIDELEKENELLYEPQD